MRGIRRRGERIREFADHVGARDRTPGRHCTVAPTPSDPARREQLAGNSNVQTSVCYNAGGGLARRFNGRSTRSISDSRAGALQSDAGSSASGTPAVRFLRAAPVDVSCPSAWFVGSSARPFGVSDDAGPRPGFRAVRPTQIAEMIQTIQPIPDNRRIQISDEMPVGCVHSEPGGRPMICRRNSMVDD
jgi:hypothetical protein